MLQYQSRATPRSAAARRSSANLQGLGASASASYAKQGASAGATVGSVIPGVGTVIGAAVGAIVGAIGGAFVGSRRPESDLWDQYKKIAGQQRGIELDPSFRAGAFVGLMRLAKNTFPPRAKGGYGPRDDARFLDDMAAQIAQAVRSGRIGASDDAKSVFSTVVGPWLAQWGTEPNADWARWENQIVTDLVDAYLYDQPIVATSYTSQRWAQPRLSDVVKSMQPAPTPPPPPAPTSSTISPAPAPLPQPIPAASSPALPAPSTLPSTSSSLVSSPAPSSSSSSAIPPAVASDTRAMIDALLAQGASQSQAFSSALQSLAAAGVQPTPQVQQALVDQVKSATPASPATVPRWAWIAGASAAAFGVAALVLRRRRRRKGRS